MKSFHFHAKMSVFVEQWMFSAILFGFGGQFSNFCEKIVLTKEIYQIPEKNLFSIFAWKIGLKWCIFATYAKISISFDQIWWKCRIIPHISQENRVKISRISREIQINISRETGRENSGFPGKEFPRCQPYYEWLLVMLDEFYHFLAVRKCC